MAWNLIAINKLHLSKVRDPVIQVAFSDFFLAMHVFTTNARIIQRICVATSSLQYTHYHY